jgi:DNA-binding IclR family transcriptional regulator
MATKTLQSLERGIDLLFLFSEEKPTLSLEGLSQALKLPESTAYRLAATLCKKGRARPERQREGVRAAREPPPVTGGPADPH